MKSGFHISAGLSSVTDHIYSENTKRTDYIEFPFFPGGIPVRSDARLRTPYHSSGLVVVEYREDLALLHREVRIHETSESHKMEPRSSNGIRAFTR